MPSLVAIEIEIEKEKKIRKKLLKTTELSALSRFDAEYILLW